MRIRTQVQWCTLFYTSFPPRITFALLYPLPTIIIPRRYSVYSDRRVAACYPPNSKSLHQMYTICFHLCSGIFFSSLVNALPAQGSISSRLSSIESWPCTKNRKKDIRIYLPESNHSCNNFLCQDELGTCISVLSIILEAGTASIINILMLTQ